MVELAKGLDCGGGTMDSMRWERTPAMARLSSSAEGDSNIVSSTTFMDRFVSGSPLESSSASDANSPSGPRLAHLVGDPCLMVELRGMRGGAVSYTHLRAHETPEHLVCRLLLEKKKIKMEKKKNIRRQV
eukprot:TRINITY_DN60954_c0_g1_i1.p1 TRINITY_DN60954_c0_g1~~TRINITY_DN60954_c0_g1_i1.p1  ORF type:complete len:130 (+),score=23.73 TRINITY_DN60954_c0_g1_i1:469-858(+)